ncbi:MAG TPA: ABC transporter substrate-binding protein, partial [Candidatus Deferrimicrobium sp.]
MHGKRTHILSYALTLLLSLALASAGVAADKEIRIGAAYPLSGNIAATGLDCLHGAELAVDIINGKYPDLNLPLAKSEGLPNLGGAKLKLIVADTKGEPRNGQAEAERLVTQEKVVAMIGAYQSSVTKTA